MDTSQYMLTRQNATCMMVLILTMSSRLVCATQLHTQKVVGMGFQPGLDPAKVFIMAMKTWNILYHLSTTLTHFLLYIVFSQIVSASHAGDIQFLDFRHHRDAYLTIHAHRGSLAALAVHRHAPLIASGSAKQRIKVFNMDGEQLGTIQYYPTFMAQKIGSVSCLTFHPYQVMLAAGAADGCVSIYADEISSPRF